jgi:ActR/RegA family two-component response regulator
MTQKKVRILLAEDDSSETVDLLRVLFPDTSGGLDLTVVSTMATLIPTVKTVDPELIILDLKLSLRDPLDAVHPGASFRAGHSAGGAGRSVTEAVRGAEP